MSVTFDTKGRDEVLDRVKVAIEVHIRSKSANVTRIEALLQNTLRDALLSPTPLSRLSDLKFFSENTIKVITKEDPLFGLFTKFSYKCHEEISRLCEDIHPSSLTGDMTTFKSLRGKNVLQRIEPYFQWQDTIRRSGLWFFEKASSSPVQTYCCSSTLPCLGQRLR